METMEMMTPAPPDMAAAQKVFQLATGYIASAALQVATRLGVADRLANGPATIDALAGELGVHADPSIASCARWPRSVFSTNGGRGRSQLNAAAGCCAPSQGRCAISRCS
jgi:hypothetical protein